MLAAVPAAAVNTELRLERNGIADEGVAAVAEAMPQVAALSLGNERRRDLPQSRNVVTPNRRDRARNVVTPGGAQALVRAMELLRELDLTAIALGDESCKHIAWGVARSASLRRLAAPRCSIGDAGAAALGRALEVNAVLQHLDLSGNCFRTVQSIAAGLRVNPALEDLHLAQNELDSLAATHLADALTLNRTLRTLDLRGTTLRVISFRPALRINRGVRVLL